MMIAWDHPRPFTRSAHSPCPDIIRGGPLMESFAGMLKWWWFCEHLCSSWRSTPDIAGCWFQIPILILTDKKSQLLHGKGIKCRSLTYMSKLYAQEMLFVMVWAGNERGWCGKYFVFLFWRLERFIFELYGDSRDALWGDCYSTSLSSPRDSTWGLINGKFRGRSAWVDDLVARQRYLVGVDDSQVEFRGIQGKVDTGC